MNNPPMRNPLLLALLLVTCGGSNPADLIAEGDTALASGNLVGAVAKYEAALAQLDSSEDGYLEAKLRAIRAAASVTPAKAKADFDALVREKGDEIGAKEYFDVIDHLIKGDEEGLYPAVDLLADAREKFSDSQELKEPITRAGDKAWAAWGGEDPPTCNFNN